VFRQLAGYSVTISYPFTETGRSSKLHPSSPTLKKFTIASRFSYFHRSRSYRFA